MVFLKNTRKMVVLSMLVSIALALSVVDSKILVFPALPGIKIGLASIITIIILRFFGWKEALLVSIVRCLLAWFFHGSVVALILSLSGGIASTALMAVLFRGFPDRFSMTGISISGAVSHNVGQVLAASVIIQTPYIFSYLPYFLIVGAVSGYCIGFLSKRVCSVIGKMGLVEKMGPIGYHS